MSTKVPVGIRLGCWTVLQDLGPGYCGDTIVLLVDDTGNRLIRHDTYLTALHRINGLTWPIVDVPS